ncbi:MAG: hypothetical protein ABWX90_01155 [Candidatus Saccharimonadales bacterium]
MNTQTDDRQWLRYIETLRHASQPVKIDTILQKRLRAFVAARIDRSLQSGE